VLSKIARFEDLIACQKARELTRVIYQVTRRGEFARDCGLARQMQRAAVSTMANIAEGFERGGRGEFHQYLSTAKASCAEVRSHLYVALDAGYLDRATFADLLAKAEEVARIVGGLRSSVAMQRDENR
jgi:four helix bundle protein